MPKKQHKEPATWRDLKDGSSASKRHAPLSWRARLRSVWVWSKRLCVAAMLAAICAGAYYLYQNTYIEEIFSGKTERIKQIEFKTDGYITGKWLNDFLRIPAESKLSDINIFAIKQALESMGQINSATIERVYPDILRILISEHKPFMRTAVKIDYQVRLYAMSPDGVFFQPVCIPDEVLQSMPFLEGYVPVFEDNEPMRYKNAARINEFLKLAKRALPEEVQNWRAINVSEIDSLTLPLITVSRIDGGTIIFAPKELEKQLDRLEYILRYAKEKPLNKIERIDLSLKERADVKIAD